MEPFAVLDRWFALQLSVGVLSALVLQSASVLGPPGALLAGAGLSLAIALCWEWFVPEIGSGTAWRVGLVALGLGVVLVIGAWLAGVRPVPPARILYPFLVGLALVVEWVRRRWRAGSGGVAG